MRWRRRRARAPDASSDEMTASARPTRDPLVLAITEPLTRDTADLLVARVTKVAADNRVVVDVTAIPAFDSEGAAALVGLQESLGPDRVTILGFRQATARLVGADVDDRVEIAAPAGEWAIRRLHAIAVIQSKNGNAASTDALEPLLHSALAEEVGIVVVDLRNAQLTPGGVDAIAFASSAAAVRGQELLVVNVDGTMGEDLRRAGLSATTYVAPQPLD